MTPPDRRPPCAYSPDPERPSDRPPILAILVVVMASIALFTAGAVLLTAGGVMINPAERVERNP